MYYDFYKFTENPFNITPDPHFFFSSARHLEAISHLIYGIKQRKGIILVTGEIGTGKTTLCRTLLRQLDETTKSALILNPTFSDLQLLQIILNDFGLTPPSVKNKFALISTLNNFLLEQASINNNVVLIVDECQNLSVRQLEQIRLLSNLETEKQKLLQIILVGQPELCDKLRLPSLRQLNQRIAVRYHVMPLTKEELEDYIIHRIKVARNGGNQAPLEFTGKALDAIFAFSSGTPRVVNILCDRALLAGYTHELKTIDEDIIIQCAREVGAK